MSNEEIGSATAKKSFATTKAKIQNTKWESLKARGIKKPANAIETKRRLKEAHGY